MISPSLLEHLLQEVHNRLLILKVGDSVGDSVLPADTHQWVIVVVVVESKCEKHTHINRQALFPPSAATEQNTACLHDTALFLLSHSSTLKIVRFRFPPQTLFLPLGFLSACQKKRRVHFRNRLLHAVFRF